MDIPIQVVAILGLGASLKYAYKVLRGDYKNIGALISTLYLTIVYTVLAIPGIVLHGGSYVRVGIVLIFLDKMIVFSYNLFQELAKKRGFSSPVGFSEIRDWFTSLSRGKNKDELR